MIVVKLELWPYGDGTEKKTLGFGFIINDGTGTQEQGNYIAQFFKDAPRIWTEATVKNFSRLERNAFDLLEECLKAKREPDEVH